ncbi:MAG: BrnT family toxin [Pseudomonadota bacterium]
MQTPFQYHFNWDPHKAASNQRKHRVSFEQAAAVFHDPFMISMPDDEHVERWITIGQTNHCRTLLVVHTYVETGINQASVRIISARPATKQERQQYEDML